MFYSTAYLITVIFLRKILSKSKAYLIDFKNTFQSKNITVKKHTIYYQ